MKKQRDRSRKSASDDQLSDNSLKRHVNQLPISNENVTYYYYDASGCRIDMDNREVLREKHGNLPPPQP